ERRSYTGAYKIPPPARPKESLLPAYRPSANRLASTRPDAPRASLGHDPARPPPSLKRLRRSLLSSRSLLRARPRPSLTNTLLESGPFRSPTRASAGPTLPYRESPLKRR